jgi:SsrA-binding protein
VPMTAKSQKSNKHSPETVNKKAYHNYELVDKYQAGLALTGSEVKSLRSGTADLSGSYARIDERGQCWLVGANVAQYKQDTSTKYEPLRKRKLLLHKAEIRKIRIKLDQRGFTLVPLRIYFNERGLAKIELALAKGKKQFDKRQTITERDQKRDIDRSIKKYKK